MKVGPAFYKKIPNSPGVYLMRDKTGRLLYVGKAGNLRRRISSYFLRNHDFRIKKLIDNIASIDYRKTDSALEALILEANLIKKEQPPFNIREKDDTSFLFLEITKESYPRVLIVREKSEKEGFRYGPFTSSKSLREAVKILRKIFPWNTHLPTQVGNMPRECFDFQIGLCPGTCTGIIDQKEYLLTIKKLKLFLKGGKAQLIRTLEKEMKEASNHLAFEKAGKLKRQIFALQHIHDSILIDRDDFLETTQEKAMRIEGYDISNISGTNAVGSLVVFKGDNPEKNEYKKFIIKTIKGTNDTGMLKEVLSRRLKNNWPLPEIILIDGGKGQVNIARETLESFGVAIPVIGIAKGPTRKKNEFIGSIPKGISKETLIHVRDEAHRFAIEFHRYRRSVPFKNATIQSKRIFYEKKK